MFRKMHLVVFIVALAAVMVFSGAYKSEAGVGNLQDIGEASWAQQEITEMSSLGILQGYPDGKFLPYQSVTRLEAVAMLIRALGLEDQAKTMENAEVDYQVPYLPWGRGYLIMGVEKGMLDKNYLNQLEPTGAATRAQVAALVCLALNLNTTDSSLDFADTAQIPSGYQGYVATLVDNKLMQGLPGNVFEPNNVINRAQMAVLLANLLNNGFANPYPDRILTGTISTIEPVSGLITLLDGTSNFLTAECQYYLDGEKVEAADIKSGDSVKLILQNGQVVLVQAAKSNQGQVYQGRVDNVVFVGSECYVAITCLDGTELTRQASSNVIVNDSSGQMSLAGLGAGKYIEIELEGEQIVSINVLNTSTLKGKVTGIESTNLTITGSGAATELVVPAGVAVRKDNNTVNYAEIAVDDEVEVTTYDQKAIQIIILEDTASEDDLEGKIDDLDTSGTTYGITIRNSDGYKFTYGVVDDVDVNDGDSDLDFDELETGDEVRLELDSDGWVDVIEVLNSSSAQTNESGVISDLDNGSNPRLWLTNDDDEEERYYISDDVECTKDGDQIDLGDIVIGSEADIEIEDGEVVTIEITDDEDITVEGEVVSVAVRSEKIKIEQESGNQFTYYLKDGARLRDSDGDSIDLEDVEEGWDVELQLSGGKIYKLTEQ